MKQDLKKSKHSEAGFSLISVIIASSVMAVVILGTTQMIQNQIGATSYLEDRLSKTDFKGLLIGELSDPVACANTIGGYGFANNQALNAIKNKDGNSIYSTSGTNSNSFDKLKITKMDLINVTLTNAPNVTGQMKLEVHTERDRSGGGPKNLAPFDINLRVETDASSNLASCTAYGTGSGSGTGAIVDEIAKARRCVGRPLVRSRPSTTTSTGFHEEGQILKISWASSWEPDTFVCINAKWVRVETGDRTGGR